MGLRWRVFCRKCKGQFGRLVEVPNGDIFSSSGQIRSMACPSWHLARAYRHTTWVAGFC